MSRALAPTRVSTPVPAEVRYRGDVPAPTQTYARAVRGTAFGSRESIAGQATDAWTRAAFVKRDPRRDGLAYFYAYGAEPALMPQVYPGGNDGRVRSSAYQAMRNYLYNWSQNDAWYEAGYPRNLGWTFRTDQLKTNPTGGPTKSRMDTKPQFQRVQTVPRYSTTPRQYRTRSALT